ncbi:hypothetical protein ACYU03_14350 [Pseudomonas sp. X10]
MSTRKLLIALFLCGPLASHALDTESVAPEHLLALGSKLATHAGSSQWQQLWQNTRRAGHFSEQPLQPYFSLPSTQLPALARSALTNAHSVQPFARTRARYRHDFEPQLIGIHGERELNALCLEVDWRTLPPRMIDAPTAYLGQVSLLRSYPCD